MDLRIIIEKFLASKVGAGRKPKTVESYRYHFEAFRDWCETNGCSQSDLLSLMGAETIEAYIAHRRTSGLSPHTVLGDYRAIRSLYKWMVSRRIIERHETPFEFLTEPRVPRRSPKAITEKDREKLMTYIAAIEDCWIARRDETILIVLAYCGLRLSEIVDLCEDDIDFRNKRMKVFRQKTEMDTVVPIVGPVTEPLREWVEDHRPIESDYLWPVAHKTGAVLDRPMSNWGLREMCRRRCKEAKCSRIWYPHAFRHFCGMNLARLNADAVLIGAVLGHQDPRSAMEYIIYGSDDLVPAVERLYSRRSHNSF